MKKVFMTMAIVAAIFATASCACCDNCEKKAAEETACCGDCCAETKASCCDSTACTACDSTACCEQKAE